MRLRLTLEYDGTRFRGWAVQPNLRTVEGVMRDALGWVYGSWERLAVVTDKDWMRNAVAAMGWIVPGEIRVFDPNEIEEAKAWTGGL